MNAGADGSCGAAAFGAWDGLAAAPQLRLIEAFTAEAHVIWTRAKDSNMAPSIPHKLALAAQAALAVAALAALIGLSIRTGAGMPSHAIVYVNDSARTYLAPHCVRPTETLRSTTAGDARNAGYSPDSDCRDDGGFTGDGRSFTGLALERVGVLDPLQSRWNADGSWNY